MQPRSFEADFKRLNSWQHHRPMWYRWHSKICSFTIITVRLHFIWSTRGDNTASSITSNISTVARSGGLGHCCLYKWLPTEVKMEFRPFQTEIHVAWNILKIRCNVFMYSWDKCSSSLTGHTVLVNIYCRTILNLCQGSRPIIKFKTLICLICSSSKLTNILLVQIHHLLMLLDTVYWPNWSSLT